MQPSNIQIRQINGLTSAGQPLVSYSVAFNVGEHGPFTLYFSQADFTPANVQLKLREFAAGIQTIANA